MPRPEYITIGKIVNTQGHRGEVRIMPLTDFPERFLEMKEVWVNLRGQRRKMHINSARPHKQFIVIKFAEVPDMNTAELLKGAWLEIHHTELRPLPPGHYYIFEIIGLTVFTVEGKELGLIEEVVSTGSNDVYIVRSHQGKICTIPALKSVVKEVDVAGGRMVVDLLPGLE